MTSLGWGPFTILTTLSLGLAGCGSETGAREIPAWLGEQSHFEVVGTIDGEELDISLEDSADDPTQVYCTREYTVLGDAAGEPQYDMGSLTELKINAFVTVDGEPRLIELEFKSHDWQSDAPGTAVTIVPRSETMDPAAGETVLEWEWHDAATDETTYEASAQRGTVTIEHYTGTPDETGLLIPDSTGAVGVHWTARWSETEELAGSFTVPCTMTDVEIVAM